MQFLHSDRFYIRSVAQVVFFFGFLVIAAIVVLAPARAAPAGDPPRMVIGTCDLVGIVNAALELPQFASERASAEKDIEQSLSPMQREVKRLQAATMAAQGQAPDAIHINLSRAKLNLIYQEGATKQQRERLAKRQFADVYEHVQRIAIQKGRDRGITLLLQSSPDRSKLIHEADNAWFISDVLGRVAIISDGADDITDLVRDHLLAELDKAGVGATEKVPETDGKQGP